MLSWPFIATFSLGSLLRPNARMAISLVRVIIVMMVQLAELVWLECQLNFLLDALLDGLPLLEAVELALMLHYRVVRRRRARLHVGGDHWLSTYSY